jgi:hypothetical protein
VGLRLSEGATDVGIEQALAAGSILRTHTLRLTWQFVSAADVRWIQALVAPRLAVRLASRHRQLELSAATFRRSNAAIEKALRHGGHLTRAELAAVLRKTRISTAGQRLAHLLAQAELDALICSGARRGKQSTYALLDQRAPSSRALPRDAALAELARRYFQSRGPATVTDFAWWSGLTVSDARDGLESVKSKLVSDVFDGRTYWRSDVPAGRTRSSAHLLPAFDEYLVAYRNRDAVLDPRRVKRLNAGGGMLDPCIVLDGRVIGTWRRTLGRNTVDIELDLFDRAAQGLHPAITAAAARYGAFVGLEVVVTRVKRRANRDA